MALLERKLPPLPGADLDPALDDGQQLPADFQDRLAAKRSQRELALLRTDRNWWRVAFAGASVVAVVCAWGWKTAADRFANNVQVAWVKLAPNGTHQVEFFDDGGQGNRFYQATVNASLINYVEHRYRKRRETIAADYGIALQFMGPELRTDFLERFRAAQVAADHERCPSCDQVDVDIRAVDHDTLFTPDAKDPKGVYETTVYLTEKITTAGQSQRPRNKLVKLVWKVLPVAEVQKDLARLKVNPLGIDIIGERALDDLAPVADQ
jgi:hypothetical protein